MPHKSLELRRAYLRRWKLEHPELHRQRVERYRSKNFERLKAKDAARYRVNCGRAIDDDTDRRFKVTPEIIATIIRRYEAGDTCQVIAPDVGMNVSSVIRHLRRVGIEQRPFGHWMKRYALNEAAFDTITEASAYWAGFLLTDGCNHGGKAIVLSLSVKDIGHIEKFRAFLGSDHPIRIWNKASGFGGGPTATLGIGSMRLAKAAASLGIYPRKTFTAAAVPELAANRHFWRGCIDGDGSICISRGHKRYPFLILDVATEQLVRQFADFCLPLIGRCRVSNHRGNMWKVMLPGTFAVRVIRELYEDCGTYLERKHALAVEAMNRTFKRNGAGRSLPGYKTAGKVGS